MPTFSVRARRASAVAVAVTLGLGGALVVAPAANAAPYPVTSTADSGPGSLREAIGLANANPGADTITITATGTITLESQLLITEGVTINGPGITNLTITRNANLQMFLVDMAAANQDVTVDGIRFDGGAAIASMRGFDFDDTFPARNASFANSEFFDFQTTVDGGVVQIQQLTGNLLVNDTDFYDNSGSESPTIRAEGVAGATTVSDSSFYDNTGVRAAGIEIFDSSAVVISNSHFYDNEASGSGGSFYVNGIASLAVSNSSFSSNESTGSSGGAIYLVSVSGAVTLENSSLNGNTASTSAGAAYVSNVGSLSIEDSHLANNYAGVLGGAVFANQTGTTTFTGSQFLENEADDDGGALFFADLDDSLTISRSDFYENTSGGDGSAVLIDNVNTTVIVDFSTFAGNVTHGATGGALGVFDVSEDGRLRVFNDTFYDNESAAALNSGGTSIGVGDIAADAQVDIANSTFFETHPVSNPAIVVRGEVEAGDNGSAHGRLFLVSSTVVANGAFGVLTNNGVVVVSNSIVDGVGPSGFMEPFFVGAGLPIGLEWSILTSAFNGAGTVDMAGNQFSADPLLGALADNGGPTLTMQPAAASPAIDAGDPDYALAFPFDFDQRAAGFARTFNGRVDIGALEQQSASLPTMGLELSPIVPIGAALVLLLGGVLVVVARRRRTV